MSYEFFAGDTCYSRSHEFIPALGLPSRLPFTTLIRMQQSLVSLNLALIHPRLCFIL
jgi:hypothetical protein